MIDANDLDASAAVLFTLGRFHREAPDQKALDAFWELVDEWPLPLDPTTEEGLTELRESKAAAETVADIRSDHNWLYGVSATAKVAPYESVHRDRDGLLFDKQTIAVRNVYRSIGLQVPALNKTPDDHVGTEMDFIAQCFVRALDALDADNENEATSFLQLATSFLDEHVSQWAPEILVKAADAAETHFMKGVCLCSLGALNHVGCQLDELV